MSASQRAVAPARTLKVLYKKSRYSRRSERTSEALAALDAYDLHAIEDERVAAEKLRNQLLFSLNTALGDLKGKYQAAFAEGSWTPRLPTGGAGAEDEVWMTPTCCTGSRHDLAHHPPTEGEPGVLRPLPGSIRHADAKPEERVQVRRWLPSIAGTRRARTGRRQLAFGKAAPERCLHDPISLAFQPRIDRIDASNKPDDLEWDL